MVRRAHSADQEFTNPRRGAFLRLVLSGYTLATRYKTRYRWLHSGYTGQK